MPTYTMINKQTGEIQEMFLSFAERDDLLDQGEWIQQLATPKSVTHVGGTLRQTSDGWKDVLSKVKSGSGEGNTIKN